ncbi:hypothetical protein Ancab_037866 [Ancistrocladus abbreviatus]
MAKKSRKRAAQFEKNQYGCMWGLISMFDFRHVHSTQKRLPDQKRGRRHVTGTADKLELPKNSCEICKDINGGEQSESATVDAGKMSVKELMEEEMTVEEDKKKQAFDGDPNQTVMARGGHTRRSHRRASKKSFDLGDVNHFGAEDLVSERPACHKHKSSKSLDLSVMMEELCSQMYEKNISCFKHDHENELQTQSSDQDSSVLERKLGEATKVFVDHFTDEKSLRKGGKIQPSKELPEALQILNSNKEVFLKLLQDPNSQLMKHMQKLQDFQVEKDGNSKEFLEEDIGNGKHESFFWRKFKGLERSFSRRHDYPDDLNRIVVLKPGPPDSNSLKPAAIHCSLQQSPQDSGNIVSSFTEFKRRLKYAMRKEQPYPQDYDKANKAVGVENGGVPSPGRDRFFMERKPKPSSSIKKRDKIAKSEESTGSMEHDAAFTDQRVPNIYFEAKKQLAEIVSRCDAEVDFSSRKVPKSLGKIMAFPGYSSPICSPRKDGDLSFTTAQSRLSPRGECPAANENACRQVQEINADHPGSAKQVTEGESSITAGKVDNEVVAPDLGQDASAEHEVKCDLGLDRDLNSVGDDMNSEVGVKVVTSSDAAVQEHCKDLDISSGRCSLLITTGDAVESGEGKGQSACLELDTVGEDERSSSPMTSASDCWHAKKVEGQGITTDRAGQPSPISVLDLIFGDDIGPSAMRSLPVGASIRPSQIQFEEQILPPPHIVAYIKTCGEDKRSIFEFIQVVVQKSCLTWDELLRRFLLLDHILDNALFDDVESLQDRLCEDPKLLFDLIGEVLFEISWHYFGNMLSFAKPFVRPEEKGKDVIAEIWERVDWYFQQQGPCKLEEIVLNDCSKSGRWMDLRLDIESLGIEMEDAILEELVEDAILNFSGGSRESEFLTLPVDSNESNNKLES